MARRRPLSPALGFVTLRPMHPRRRRVPGPAGWILALALTLATQAACAVDLNEAERAWIAAHPVVRIQMGDLSPPFEFHEDGRWQGLAYDLLTTACDRLGLRVEVTGMPWSQALESVGTGAGVDLLLAVTTSPERKRQMLLTAPYLSFPQVIIADHQRSFISGLADLRQATVTVERDYVMEGWLRRDLPEARFLVFNDSLDCLRAVAEGRADAYVGNLALASWLIDRHGLVNIGVAAPSGYGDEEFSMGIRKDWPELVALLDRALAAMPHEERQALRQKWLAVRYEFGLRTGDLVRWVLIVAAIALVFIIQLRLLVRRRTQALAREVELRREREAHLAEAQRLAHLGSWTWNPDGDVLLWSEETRTIFGWPGDRPVTVAEVLASIHPDDRERVQRAGAVASSPQPMPDVEYRIIRPDGVVRHLFQRCIQVRDADQRVIRVDGIVLDITDRKSAEVERERLEQSLRHAEKLRVIGQLAGGIAHDFNNLLTGISGNAELIQRAIDGLDGPEVGRMRRQIEVILAQAGRAATITRQLRIFARRDEVIGAPADVHRLISETVDLIRHSDSAAIEIRTDLTATRHIVAGDDALLQTALANLVFNARDAMPQGGRLTITTRDLVLDEPPADAQTFDFQPGLHIEIAVSDTGVGMDAGVRGRLFEPFFTTKKPGKGTGLGLANVFGCVRNHRGAIHVESEPSKGSTFRLFLPLVEGRATPQRIPKPLRGAGRILVVDDDEVVRSLARDLLRELGYEVEVAESGPAALELIRARPGSIDLVILDMIMPGMDGETALKNLRASDPRLRFLICSGAFPEGAALPVEDADGFLQKPYTLAALSRAISGILGR